MAASASPIRLHYFDGRGLAEGIRFVLGALGLEWEDVHLTERSQMLALIDAGDLMFNQVRKEDCLVFGGLGV